MTTLMTPDQTLFESAYCSRCGGSGKFSFNLMSGDRCFGCSGSGVQLTKRGKAAKAFLIESQQVAVADLEPGMFVWDDMYGKVAKFLPVLAVGQNGSYHIVDGVRVDGVCITTKRGGHYVWPDSKIRAVRDEAQRKEQIAAALAYQATLTKEGKPRKAEAV